MSELITGKKAKLIKALKCLEILEQGGRIKGELSFHRKGYGKVVGAWRDKWVKPIEFRMKRTPFNDSLEYRTDATGWSNMRYGSPYDLLCGHDFQRGATKHRVINMEQEIDE